MTTPTHKILDFLAIFRYMQIKRQIIVFVFLLTTGPMYAQEATTETTQRPHRYFNVFQSGGLFGEKGRDASVTFSTFHGVQLKKVHLALGTGLDSYQQWRVVPAYVMVSVDLAHIKENFLYLSLAGGVGKAWYRKQNEWDPDFDANRAISVSPAVGYRILADKWNINISAGYKWQRIDYSYTYNYWDSYYRGGESTVEQTMERLVVQLGFGLN